MSFIPSVWDRKDDSNNVRTASITVEAHSTISGGDPQCERCGHFRDTLKDLGVARKAIMDKHINISDVAHRPDLLNILDDRIAEHPISGVHSQLLGEFQDHLNDSH